MLLNNCAFLASASGLVDFAVAGPIVGSISPSLAGAVSGVSYSYVARSPDKTQWEIGAGTYVEGATVVGNSYTLSTNRVWSGYTCRQLFPSSMISSGAGKVRVTFSTYLSSGTISDVWIGPAARLGNPWAFDGTQVQLTFGGLASRNCSGSEVFTSDLATFTLDPTRPLMVSFYCAGTIYALNSVSTNTSPAATPYYAGPGDFGGVNDGSFVSGNTTYSEVDFITKIEMVATPTLIRNTITSSSNSNGKVNFSVIPTVSIDAMQGDIVALVTSLNDLAALPLSTNVAFLILGGRTGNFAWDSADHTLDVTNDPRQGIFVATIRDATGASGAWKRQFSGAFNLGWWGLVDGGVSIYDDDHITPLYETPRSILTLSWAAGFVTGTISGGYTWPVWAGWPIGTRLDAIIAGMAPAKYNGKVIITSVGTNTFTYQVITDTSSTVINPAVGSKTITVKNGSTDFVIGALVHINDTYVPTTNWMEGLVTAYNSGTKSLTINVTSIGSSPTNSWVWTVGVSPGSETSLGTIALPLYATAASVANGIANSTALAGFGIYARSLGRKHLRFMSPPAVNYCFDDGLCSGWIYNLAKEWVFENVGTTWTNVSVNGVWPWFIWTYPLQSGGSDSRFDPTTGMCNSLIATTVPGTQTGIFLTPSDASKYSIGEIVLAGGLDIQHYGFPINLQYFEYWTITSLDPIGGTFTIKELIRNQLRSDWPDGNYVLYTSIPSGRARIWKMNTPGHWIGFGDGTYTKFTQDVNWGVSASIIGPMTVNYTPYGFVNSGGIQTYMNICGYRTHTHKITGPGFSDSIANENVHDFKVDTSQGEIDKLICSLSYNYLDSQNWSHVHQSPNDRVTYRNSKIYYLACFAKNFEADNCDIWVLGIGSLSYGLCNNIAVRNSRIFNMSNNKGVYDGENGATGNIVVDGTVWTFAYGIFKQPLSAGYTNVSIVPGQYMSFNQTAIGFAGDLGTMLVLSTYQDLTYIYIETDSELPSVPSWSTGTVATFQIMDAYFENCTGCNEARNFSEACRLGHRYYEYNKITNTGMTVSVSGYWLIASGFLTKLTVTVRNTGTTTSTMLGIALSSWDGSTFVGDAYPGTVFNINTGVAGKRVLTVGSSGAFVGQKTLDNVQIAGVTQSSGFGIPPGKIFGSELNLYSVLTGTKQQTPTVDIEMEWDYGRVRKSVTLQTLPSGSILTGVVGQLP